MDVFHDKREAGKTIVLVTHDMATVQSLCHRALVLDHGELSYIGDPETAAIRYYALNLGGDPAKDREDNATPNFHARVVHAGMQNEAGDPVDSVERGAPLVLDVLLEARRELVAPRFIIHGPNADGVLVVGLAKRLSGPAPGRVGAGERVRLSGRIENSLSRARTQSAAGCGGSGRIERRPYRACACSTSSFAS
jgi:hypothetical protein